ncbi:hypothetical protein CHH92_01600 [Bacillus sonorensis]|nr:hypothetical protein [Bacillus sonorensis]PAD62188.1 hypothetical protein CHH92_01600 [Bacillus sonorensis]RHJ13577.1 hypothetical protein DW143_02985 [Bacillus sonorensis]TWK72883.1 hypothetical protein CHCC20335_1548 [Bacillus paralicheniformis]
MITLICFVYWTSYLVYALFSPSKISGGENQAYHFYFSASIVKIDFYTCEKRKASRSFLSK